TWGRVGYRKLRPALPFSRPRTCPRWRPVRLLPPGRPRLAPNPSRAPVVARRWRLPSAKIPPPLRNQSEKAPMTSTRTILLQAPTRDAIPSLVYLQDGSTVRPDPATGRVEVPADQAGPLIAQGWTVVTS